MPSRVLALLLSSMLLGACTAAAPSDDGRREREAAEADTARSRVRADLTPQIAQVLEDIRAADSGQLAISEADGRFLRTLVVATGAKRVLEIGGASGYSGIWMGLGLRETGGSLVTVEYDPDRARALQANITAAGLDDVVEVVAGDAFEVIPGLAGSFDLIFLDAWKSDYLKFLETTLPRLETGGLFVAHNVVNKRDEMPDFLEAIDTRSDLISSIVSPGSEGMSISVKR